MSAASPKPDSQSGTNTSIALLQDVHLAYGSQTVLSGLDWQLQPGQVVGLLGRNGAGKSSLLESLLGLRSPHAGNIQLFGRPVDALGDAERARIGYVPQQAELFEWLTANQMLTYFRSFYPRWNEAKVDGLLTRWDIARDKPIARLSGGQKQRLSIIRALAHEPDLLVLDEPVSGLDPVSRRDFLRELVEQVLERQTTVVFSTHILSDLERVAVDVAFMQGGRIALQASLDELLENCHSLSGPRSTLQTFIKQTHLVTLHRRALPGNAERCLVQMSPQKVLQMPDELECQAVNLEELFLELTQ
jgi:ABC-2 type transport system ATP-binding protein